MANPFNALLDVEVFVFRISHHETATLSEAISKRRRAN
jgi:hypothetical protein